jgi:hypothetical protein
VKKTGHTLIQPNALVLTSADHGWHLVKQQLLLTTCCFWQNAEGQPSATIQSSRDQSMYTHTVLMFWN